MSNGKVATLSQELKCFEQPDAQSGVRGLLQPKQFNVLEERQSFPSKDTDYLLLSTPGIGTGQAWICSRWKTQRYASVTESASAAPVITNAARDGMTIAESFLVARLKDFRGYGYDLTKNISYPWPLPGVTLPTGRLEPKINCCTFVEALLVKAWEDAMPGRFNWSLERHKQMMILGKDLFSPVTAVLEAGMATPIEDLNAPPQAWTVVQGWKRLQPNEGGHTYLIVAQRDGVVLTLEANAAYELNGVGFRGLGNAEKFGFKPPPGWWQNPDLWKGKKMWTWQQLRQAYTGLKLARLKVSDQRWAA